MTRTTDVEAPGNAVVATGLTRDYGGGAGVYDADLRVARGTVFGLVGPNGAGKTTLISLLCGVRRPDRGTVSVRAERVALCPDVPDFEPWLTASEVVSFGARLRGQRVTREQVERALERVGLSGSAHRRNRSFSRGMRQRLGLAAALVCDPDLIVLDEPVSGLDPQGRADLLNLVSDMRGERTVLFSSHLLDDVQRVCDEVAVLKAGRVVYQGSVGVLVDRHVRPSWHLWTRGRAHELAPLFNRHDWVTHAAPVDPDCLHLEAVSVEAGEYGMPRVLAEAGAGLVGMSAHEADLESAFVSLTREAR
ncbi:ABC transporter ATP-binding protein [Nocardiopsis aegyptia]|uniref:ABC-2 type transport system ATP-binding protein n=1 Tax=Nocardiopsis aegyptia TaxID=220378 RepID=A0A7Z0JBU5_9ACTN|nr:ABC transporter ATP-binding protein [Nocardiopsis aegyptia]NYJ35835.1 ABC-2 type transport system ATP-binding protein [Nocardiopsis aegyptia]